MAKVASKAYWTDNYDMFKYIEGNRMVDDRHVRRLMRMMTENGYDGTRPIKVNERMQITDGQHRLEAARRLGIEIAYVISDGADLKDCIEDNSGRKAWTDLNFINAYAELGQTDYIYMRNLLKQFSKLPLKAIFGALQSGSSDTVRQGRMRISPEQYSEAEKALRYMMQFMPILEDVEEKGKHSAYMEALAFCYYCDAIDSDMLLAKVKSNSDRIKKASRREDAVNYLGTAYNTHTVQDKRVNFGYEYEKYARMTKAKGHEKSVRTKKEMQDDN